MRREADRAQVGRLLGRRELLEVERVAALAHDRPDWLPQAQQRQGEQLAAILAGLHQRHLGLQRRGHDAVGQRRTAGRPSGRERTGHPERPVVIAQQHLAAARVEHLGEPFAGSLRGVPLAPAAHQIDREAM